MVLAQSLAGCGQPAAETVGLQRPDGPVLDSANILPAATEAALDKRLRDYVASSGNALIVVSVTSLDGKTIDQYAYDLYNEWGIGDAKTNRGLLVLVAPYDRQVRIEVGCGVESVITNEAAKQVIEENMIPEFKTDDLEGGTLAGVDALVARLDAGRDFGPVSPKCVENMKKAA
jgi:uncharacterized protein